VDEGRRADAQDARAGEDKDNGDCAQTEADAPSHEAESNETWCDPGGQSREEEKDEIGSRRGGQSVGRSIAGV
jgi:hypothetical protein